MKSPFNKDCRWFSVSQWSIRILISYGLTLCFFGKRRSIKSSGVYNRSRRVRLAHRKDSALIRHVGTVCMYQMIRSTVREKDND